MKMSTVLHLKQEAEQVNEKYLRGRASEITDVLITAAALGMAVGGSIHSVRRSHADHKDG